MKKVLFVATVLKTHINVFHLPYLKMFKEMGYETHVAARNDFENPEDCIIPYCDVYHDITFERNPIKKENILAYKQLKKIMLDEKYDIVHCHTPVGGVLTRLAFKSIKYRIKTKCIYTAHGFHFYKGAPLLNWVIYYPIEKYLSKYTDVLITINKEDYIRAKQKFNMKKIEYIPGVGIDENKFQLKNFDRDEYRKKLNISQRDFLICSIGELNSNKNHEIILRSLSRLQNANIKYLIVGKGHLFTYLRDLSKKLNIEENVILVGYRKDISEILHSSDLFIFPSLREGLPVSVMEAIMSDTLCAVSNTRGNVDLIENGVNGYVFNNDVIEIVKVINKVLSLTDNEKEVLLENNVELKEKISLKNICNIYKSLYEKLLEGEAI